MAPVGFRAETQPTVYRLMYYICGMIAPEQVK